MRREVRFSDHAVDRYIELVRPCLTLRGAFLELQGVRHSLEVIRTEEPPEWYNPRPPGAPPDDGTCVGYLVWGDIAFPLVNAVNQPEAVLAVTCVVRGSLSARSRKRRSDSRAERQLDKRYSSKRRRDRPRRP